MRILKNVAKWCMITVFVLSTTYIITFVQEENLRRVAVKEGIEMEMPKIINNWEEYKTLRLSSNKKLSNLGKILYLGESFQPKQNSIKYKILMWKYGKFLERRHLLHFTNKRFDPFEKCSVRNCIITYNETELESADLIIVHLQRLNGRQQLPLHGRKNKQIWAFLTDESPYHTFANYKVHIRDFNGVFNWSMTYRMDSDIPVPYGRTLPLDDNEKTEFDFEKWNANKKQDVLIAILSSNCYPINHRWDYVEELSKYIRVDTYGRCGKLKCDNKYYYGLDCRLVSNYKFYLSFENSNCNEYITEKVWWQAYHKENIPIVMGSSKNTYRRLLPPDSYLNVEDFASPRALADYVMYLNNTPSMLKKFFNWKQKFKIVNEHGYFQTDSYHYCRACEALNYNEKNQKIYDNLNMFWSTNDCNSKRII